MRYTRNAFASAVVREGGARRHRTLLLRYTVMHRIGSLPRATKVAWQSRDRARQLIEAHFALLAFAAHQLELHDAAGGLGVTDDGEVARA